MQTLLGRHRVVPPRRSPSFLTEMKLTHIGISNFRSIGEDFVTIDLTKKVNVLVGANK
jgi:hypothetical protein